MKTILLRRLTQCALVTIGALIGSDMLLAWVGASPALRLQLDVAVAADLFLISAATCVALEGIRLFVRALATGEPRS